MNSNNFYILKFINFKNSWIKKIINKEFLLFPEFNIAKRKFDYKIKTSAVGFIFLCNIKFMNSDNF